jgi:hypothetical protein
MIYGWHMEGEMATVHSKVIYWHRELPPFDAAAIGEHTQEASSMHVPGTLAHRDELWERCYADLMANVSTGVEREVARLGGHYVHVLAEFVDSKHSDVTNEAWLHGSFRYMVYRQPAKA